MDQLVVTDSSSNYPTTDDSHRVDTLSQENRQLAKDLKITEKLLELYRKCVKIFDSNCVCDQSIDNRSKLETLDRVYDQYISSKTIRGDIKTDPNVATDETLAANLINQRLLDNISLVNLVSEEHEDYDDNDNDSESEEPSHKRQKISESSDTSKILVCEWDGCDRSFNDNFHLQRHIRAIHTLEKPFDCRQCDKSFSRSDHLLKHVRNSHQNYDKFKCSHKDCKFETIFEDKIKLHEDRHQISCERCEQSFCSHLELKHHNQECHKLTKTRVRRKYVKRDIESDEEDEDNDLDEEEEECGFPKKALSEMEVKMRLKSSKRGYPSRQEVVCAEEGCGKVFKCIQNMRKHVKTVHLGLRPFPCDWPGCESAFKTREAMTNHKSVHCDDRKFKCEFEGCHKSFKLRCKLTQHLRCHGIGPKNERFPCSWPACGIFCQSEQALTEHLNRHQNIRPFVCVFVGCGKAYFTSFELKQHSMKFHEQNESFKCDYKDCPMVYLNKRDLSKHRRLHEDMARFICSWPECSHTFNTSKELSDHMNRHLDIRANKCNFIGCGRSYFTRKDLSRHIRKSHS